MSQTTYSVLPKSSPPAPAKKGWTIHRAFVVAAAAALIGAILFEFGLDIGPEIAPGVPGLVLAIVLVFYEAAWLYLAAGILLAVLPLMVLFLFGEVKSLLDPTQGRSYMSLMMLVLTALLALPSGIRGFVEKRRGTGRPLSQTLASKHGAIAAALAVFVVAAGLTGVASGARVKDALSAGGGYDFPVELSVPVTIAEYAFEPTSVPVPAGQIVELKVANQDTTGHTFTYDYGGKTYSHEVPGGATVGFLVKFDEAGTIPYWCIPHSSGTAEPESDEEMRGTITVT